MSMQEENRSALASISALMPCWFLMTKSAEDTSLGQYKDGITSRSSLTTATSSII